MSWKCMAITLDPKSKRFQEFIKNNCHLDIEVFQGIKGVEMDEEEIVKKGLATTELLKSGLTNRGRLGCAASHREIWRKAAKEELGYLVLEDDCYTHADTKRLIENNQIGLMQADICRLGINTNSILESISPAGLHRLSLFNPKHPNKKWISNAFSKTDYQKVEFHRLLKCFGNCAYFVSPTGAKKLEKAIFPLSTRTTSIPLVTEKMPACGLDRAANGSYSQLKAFVCQPFLAYTPNTDSQTNE